MRTTTKTSGSPQTQTANKNTVTANSMLTGENIAFRTVAVLLSRFTFSHFGGTGHVSS